MPFERVCAAAARLLDSASLRVGGEEYANDHETYGLATLLKEHATVRGDAVELSLLGGSEEGHEGTSVREAA